MKKLLLLSLFLGLQAMLRAQADFSVYLVADSVPNLPGLQSYAFAQWQGKWLLVGGRLDGLHRRQPWASFDQAGHNNGLYVVDPAQRQQWSAPLSLLPSGLAEQLSSTNMSFYQVGPYLYLVGGYGYSSTAADHITYPNLSSIRVDSLITAIQNGQTNLNSYFQQITDQRMAVAGGRMEKMYDHFYLVGGNRFDGRYNPMGNPTFTQAYTNEVRRFRLSNSPNLQIQDYTTWNNLDAFHRRDYNLGPVIRSDGSEGMMVFSGVFMPTADLPYLNSVSIDSSGYQINSTFSQYLNHYHCANLGLYDSLQNQMHTVFFGGIAQYTMDAQGNLVQDNNVPFVPTIARVSRNAQGQLSEHKLPVEMPSLLGAGSEFIPLETLPHYENKVFRYSQLQGDTVLLGHIFGGIASSAPNIFTINDGTQSSASTTLFKVYLLRNTGLSSLATAQHLDWQVRILGRRSCAQTQLRLQSPRDLRLRLSLHSLDGRLLHAQDLGLVAAGEQNLSLSLPCSELPQGQLVVLKLEDEKGKHWSQQWRLP